MVLGGSLHSLDDIQTLTATFLFKNPVKFSRRCGTVNSYHVKLLTEVLLGVGRRLHFLDDFQNQMGTSLSHDISLVKL